MGGVDRGNILVFLEDFSDPFEQVLFREIVISTEHSDDITRGTANPNSLR